MPVTRVRERVQTGGRAAPSGRPADTSPLTGVLEQNGQMMARLAADYGQIMAQTAAEEGEALAKAAVFSTGPNGLPQLPEDLEGRMGRIASRVYNQNIEQHYTHALQTAIRAQIRDAENANMYDPEAFQRDVEDRIAGMAMDLPDEYAGVFDRLVEGEMVDAGLSIGRRVAQVADATQTSQIPVMTDNWRDRALDAVWAGNDDVARTMAESLDFIFDAQDHILTPGQKEELARGLWAEVGAARLIRDLDLVNSDDPAEIASLIERLNSGRDPELMKYFEDPRTGEPSYEMAAVAADRLGQYLSASNQRATAIRQRDQTAADMTLMVQGVTTKSKERQATLDLIYANDIGLEADGQRRPMQWQDWFGLNADQRHRLVRRTKDVGYLSTSLEQAFRRLDTYRDSDEAADLFLLYRDLKEGPNNRGEVRDMTGDLPERVQQVMELASALHGFGGVASESIGEAFRLMDGLEGQDWGDEQLADLLNRKNREWGRDTRITEETAQGELRRLIGTNMSDIEMGERQMGMATTLLETWLRTDNSLEDSLAMTRAAMEGRFSESGAMLGVERSEYAPG